MYKDTMKECGGSFPVMTKIRYFKHVKSLPISMKNITVPNRNTANTMEWALLKEEIHWPNAQVYCSIKLKLKGKWDLYWDATEWLDGQRCTRLNLFCFAVGWRKMITFIHNWLGCEWMHLFRGAICYCVSNYLEGLLFIPTTPLLENLVQKTTITAYSFWHYS